MESTQKEDIKMVTKSASSNRKIIKIIIAVFLVLLLLAGGIGAFIYVQAVRIAKVQKSVRATKDVSEKLYQKNDELTKKLLAFDPGSTTDNNKIKSDLADISTKVSDIEAAEKELENTINNLQDKDVQDFKRRVQDLAKELDAYISFEKDTVGDLTLMTELALKSEEFAKSLDELGNAEDMDSLIIMIDKAIVTVKELGDTYKGKAKNQDLNKSIAEIVDVNNEFLVAFKSATKALDIDAMGKAGADFDTKAKAADEHLKSYVKGVEQEEQKYIDAVNKANEDVASAYNSLNAIYKLK